MEDYLWFDWFCMRLCTFAFYRAGRGRGCRWGGQTVVEGGTPDDIPEFWPDAEARQDVGLLNLMHNADLTESNSEGRRLIEREAVSIDDETVEDTGRCVDEQAPFVLQVAKRRYARIVNGTE